MINVDAVVGAGPGGGGDGDGGDPLHPSRLFPCIDYAARNLSGIGFRLHAEQWPSASDMCAWAGPLEECSFADLVQLLADSRVEGHPAYGMALGISGLLFFTPDRVWLGSAMDSQMEDKLVLVRRIVNEDGIWSNGRISLRAISWPLMSHTWALIGGTLAAHVMLSGLLAVWRPTSVRRLGAGPGLFRLRALQWAFNFTRILCGGRLTPDEEPFAQALTIHRTTPLAVFTIAFFFFEAAFILGARPAALSRSMQGLTDDELCRWAVNPGTAQEDLWLAIVNRGRPSDPVDVAAVRAGRADRRWASCQSPAECFEAVRAGKLNPNPACGSGGGGGGGSWSGAPRPARTEVYVSWTIEVRAAFRDNPDLCRELEVLDAEAELFTFSAGWMLAYRGGGVRPVAGATRNATTAGATAWAAAPPSTAPAPTTTGAAAAAKAAAETRRRELNYAFCNGRVTQATTAAVEAAVGAGTPCAARIGRVHPEQLVIPLVVVFLATEVTSVVAAVGMPVLMAALAAASAAAGGGGVHHDA